MQTPKAYAPHFSKKRRCCSLDKIAAAVKSNNSLQKMWKFMPKCVGELISII